MPPKYGADWPVLGVQISSIICQIMWFAAFMCNGSDPSKVRGAGSVVGGRFARAKIIVSAHDFANAYASSLGPLAIDSGPISNVWRGRGALRQSVVTEVVRTWAVDARESLVVTSCGHVHEESSIGHRPASRGGTMSNYCLSSSFTFPKSRAILSRVGDVCPCASSVFPVTSQYAY